MNLVTGTRRHPLQRMDTLFEALAEARYIFTSLPVTQQRGLSNYTMSSLLIVTAGGLGSHTGSYIRIRL